MAGKRDDPSQYDGGRDKTAVDPSRIEKPKEDGKHQDPDKK